MLQTSASAGCNTRDLTGCCAAGSSKIDIDVPKKDVILSWATLSDYVQQCRWSRVLGGVHFEVSKAPVLRLAGVVLFEGKVGGHLVRLKSGNPKR